MPQKLSNVCTEATVSFHFGHSTNKPELAELTAGIFARWAWIEHQLSLLLLFVLGAEAKPALAMFSVLTTQRLRGNATSAAAKAALPRKKFEIFRAVMGVIERVANDRHRLAHWLWATSPELPHALLLADPDHMKTKEMQRAEKRWSTKPDDPTKLFLPDPSEILVYTKKDLERVKRDMGEASVALVWLRYFLSPLLDFETGRKLRARGEKGPLGTSSEALDELMKLRLFREELDRLRRTHAS
jgi:hypothetical protein